MTSRQILQLLSSKFFYFAEYYENTAVDALSLLNHECGFEIFPFKMCASGNWRVAAAGSVIPFFSR